ncbi:MULTISPECIES: PTS lactose/cellobiose transporter subunit IIA [unclassified Breznakia]|uniref:PTS lactose/cellobiose transporter subunit IIA n=1 Tax=unclassified Breznakia TaxID=2623764 RepID=UPI0024761FC4|nr:MULTISPECIES: PTS lactose/cellobiose transporter subunit IIA [unclassified Breznakia]MDH6366557.1 PTS system cellobiose-specific IIA component [Breznakia sp. PH1-1]MDH6403650.1 PTS system cellobiose-specific IIA component [Breznakia sp. PF1-11]MDH6411359.1 PTS system cellobiose-specific IIA component [Breznakia sp. PFB1-11]MDH6413665.1 PTS system cellobiose-specific IIA component [Breznakia sp. PFB1-14]MDH6415904.1 PTS system cellobiose-specific IIA component [Breznakia sp. PFB1-4]
MSDTRVEKAMEIILAAGDARSKCMEALEAIANEDITKAESLLKEAQYEITKAHQVQTETIQEEMRDEQSTEYSLLFAHAQDTLMTIYSEINITKQLIKIFNKVYEKMNA